ncbi:MAG: SRPBCC family protein [Candidatus Tectomicrobia bacterium]|uniref:SRPBCC family protein n=1 Tax=Tectimicrobiota bacterium TaxID=2528274 RepID=A0A932I1M1_UNCTE|nr:SRPBCC family protein [Candidatus Tectomicrobia bacterium]
MNKLGFVYVTYIATTPEKLWEALTSGDFTLLYYWSGRRVQSVWMPGSPVRHTKEDGSLDWQGEVLQADPPKLLSYTFDVAMGGEGRRERPSRVTFEIIPFMGHVKLTLTHGGFEPGSKVLPGISRGWPAILSSLKSLLEGGKALFPLLTNCR